MTRIGTKITDELEYTPAKCHINRYKQGVYITKEDETGAQRQVVATLDRPIPKCIAGPGLLSNIMVDKFVYHIPLHRKIQMLKQEDVHIPASRWIRGLALLQIMFGRYMQFIKPIF